MTKQRLREHSMVSCDCALVSFFFPRFLVFVSWSYLLLPWGTWGRDGGCVLGGQLCAALTGCVRLDSSYLATLLRAHVCFPGAYLLLAFMFSS